MGQAAFSGHGIFCRTGCHGNSAQMHRRCEFTRVVSMGVQDHVAPGCRGPATWMGGQVTVTMRTDHRVLPFLKKGSVRECVHRCTYMLVSNCCIPCVLA